MLEYLWGYKTVAALDVWSLDHFLSGLAIGTMANVYNRKTLKGFIAYVKDKLLTPREIKRIKFFYGLMIVLMVAYFWEALEHYLEAGLAGEWLAYWLQGVEFWANRLIADPLLMALGFITVSRFPFLFWPGRVLAFLWLVIHLFVFPHSMYLQQWF